VVLTEQEMGAAREDPAEGTVEGGPILEEQTTLEGALQEGAMWEGARLLEGVEECEGGVSLGGGTELVGRTSRTDPRVMSAFQVPAQKEVRGATDLSSFMARTQLLRK
jgi:hypothetical protein